MTAVEGVSDVDGVASSRRESRRHASRGDRVRAGVERFGLLGALATFLIVFSVWMPDRFATASNLRNMITSQAIILLLALAATIVLRTGDFDLSIAAVMTTAAASSAVITRDGGSFFVVVLVALAIGLMIGLLNGWLVVKVGVSSFITTLGMLTALSGVTFAIVDSKVIFNLDGVLLDVARQPIFGLPSRVWFGWAMVLVFWYVYERTPLGRYLLFVGGSRESARLAGLNVDRIRIGAFVASSVLAALTGVLLAGFLAGIDPSVGSGFLLQPFAGAFLGATALHVGRFNAFGTLIALYVLTAGITGLQLLGADRWVTDVFNGVALVLAVTFARLAGGRRA